MRFRLVAAIVAVLVLAGCGGSPAAKPKAAAPTAAAVASSSPAIPPAAADTVFDQYVTNQGLTAHGDVAELENGAHLICESYAAGHTFAEVVAALTQNGWTGYEAGQMNGAAVAAYCPQYKDKAP